MVWARYDLSDTLNYSLFQTTGEPIVEPDVDLSAFLERQRISDELGPSVVKDTEDDDDVDHSLDHLSSRASGALPSKKGNVEQIEWNDEFDELTRDKAAAEATWGAMITISTVLFTDGYSRSQAAIPSEI